MIFVTVGTHEQQFNRLIEAVDRLICDGTIQEDVTMQTGYSTYVPKHCKWSQLFPYSEMVQMVSNARIVITHGGPASFIMPLQVGKIPIVVPRQHGFGEHVNDHQVEFVKAVEERMGNIIPVYEIRELKSVIKRYEDLIAAMNINMSNNNQEFIVKFNDLVKQLLG